MHFLRSTQALGFLILAAACCADDSAMALRLESLGGKVTRTTEGAITHISFTDCEKLRHEEIREIGQLQSLTSLTLYGGKQRLNDETVGGLLGLKKLENLSTEGAKLSDSGLARLAALKELKSASFFHLSFRLEGFTGKGFAAWKDLPHLEKLTVAGMSMGDDGFAAISQISTLRQLSTWHTYQTEAGNLSIAKLPLKELKIGQRLPNKQAPPSLTDDTLNTLASIATLERLTITEARLSLDALRKLKALPLLKALSIAECEVSDADLAKLRSELPAIKIDFAPLTEEQRKKLEAYLR